LFQIFRNVPVNIDSTSSRRGEPDHRVEQSRERRTAPAAAYLATLNSTTLLSVYSHTLHSKVRRSCVPSYFESRTSHIGLPHFGQGV
jgi:hypothetical protein